MELHLIRHPRPAIAPGVCYGQSDIGIIEDANTVADRLRPCLPERFTLYSSPLKRARLLAEALGQPTLDARLKEIHFGDWELAPFDTIGDAISAWEADPLGFCAPGGESANQMATRVSHWLQELLAAKPAEPAVVVAHGGPLRVIAGSLLGLPPERWLALEFACGHGTRFDVHDWGTVMKWFNR